MKKSISEAQRINVKVCYGRMSDDFCSVCGIRSKAKLFIEIRKGCYYVICQYCFSDHLTTPIGDLKKLIKNSHL